MNAPQRAVHQVKSAYIIRFHGWQGQLYRGPGGACYLRDKSGFYLPLEPADMVLVVHLKEKRPGCLGWRPFFGPKS